jgi:DNA replication protein DnaC
MTTTTFDKNKFSKVLKELHLPTVRNIYEAAIKEAEKNSMRYEEFLFGLMEQERFDREQRKNERLLRQSKLPIDKTMASFDLARLPMKEVQKVKGLLDGKFTDRNENVLAFGNPGSGKTHLLCAIAQALVKKGKRVYFSSCSMLVQELLAAKKELKLAKVLKKLSAYDTLVIDDIGYVQQDREEMEVLFTLLAERYERGSVMISSNLPFSKWEKIFKDPMTTAAAIDRLVHHSVILELNLSSFRLEAAKNRSLKTDNKTKQKNREK